MGLAPPRPGRDSRCPAGGAEDNAFALYGSEDPGVKETPRRTSPELADRTVENLSLAAPPAVVFDKVSVMTTS